MIVAPVVAVGDAPPQRTRRLPSRDATLPWIPSRTPPPGWADAARASARDAQSRPDGGPTARQPSHAPSAARGAPHGASASRGDAPSHRAPGGLSVSPVASSLDADLSDDFTPVPRFRRPGAVFWVIGAAVVGVFIVWGAVQATDCNLPPAQTAAQAASARAAVPQARLAPEGNTPSVAAAAAPAEPVPSPAASGAAAPTTSAADAPQTVSVELRVRPEGAQIFYKGKPLGRTPYTLELPKGERRSVEVVAAGYTTRKVTIDGTKPLISFAMRPEEPREEDSPAPRPPP